MRLNSLCRIISIFVFAFAFVLVDSGSSFSATPPVKPLWKKGRYYGGYPTIDKYLTQGIIFDIAPDKITMKEISIEFPAECFDEVGNIQNRSVHFSAAAIEPLTLARHSRSQTVSFAYLDEFGHNWNTDLKIKWNRERQSFRVQISTITDEIEGTFCKADAVVAKGARRGVPSTRFPL